MHNVHSSCQQFGALFISIYCFISALSMQQKSNKRLAPLCIIFKVNPFPSAGPRNVWRRRSKALVSLAAVALEDQSVMGFAMALSLLFTE